MIGIAASLVVYTALVKPLLTKSLPDDPALSLDNAWRMSRGAWVAATVDFIVDQMRPGMPGLPESAIRAAALSYAEQMGDYIHETSRDATLRGLERQLASGVADRAAWTRSVAGVGLDEPQTRAYLAAAKAENATQLVPPAADSLSRRMLLERAERIAANEAHAMREVGKVIGWSFSEKRGDIPAGSKVRWVTAKDERVCPTCGPLHGQSRDPGQAFEVNGIRVIAPGIHPNCRCRVILLKPTMTIKKAYRYGRWYEAGTKRDEEGQFSRVERRGARTTTLNRPAPVVAPPRTPVVAPVTPVPTITPVSPIAPITQTITPVITPVITPAITPVITPAGTKTGTGSKSGTGEMREIWALQGDQRRGLYTPDEYDIALQNPFDAESDLEAVQAMRPVLDLLRAHGNESDSARGKIEQLRELKAKPVATYQREKDRLKEVLVNSGSPDGPNAASLVDTLYPDLSPDSSLVAIDTAVLALNDAPNAVATNFYNDEEIHEALMNEFGYMSGEESLALNAWSHAVSSTGLSHDELFAWEEQAQIGGAPLYINFAVLSPETGYDYDLLDGRDVRMRLTETRSMPPVGPVEVHQWNSPRIPPSIQDAIATEIGRVERDYPRANLANRVYVRITRRGLE